MAPTVYWQGHNVPTKEEVANATLAACKDAANHADFAPFAVMSLWNGVHTSKSEKDPHVTVKVKTEEQKISGHHWVVHIFLDANYAYVRHEFGHDVMTDENPNKSSNRKGGWKASGMEGLGQ